MTRMFGIMSIEPDYPLGSYPYRDAPKWAIIREIDLVINNTSFGAEYVLHYSRHTPMKAINSAAEFQQLLREVASPSYVWSGGISGPKPPFRTKLSLNSKKELAYVVLKLSQDAWQFPTSGAPVRIGQPGHSAEAYYEARRVDEDGNVYDEDQTIEGCKLAYFISDGEKTEAMEPFEHLFNIYVELRVLGSEPMPIRIDPDVRHPGGSDE